MISRRYNSFVEKVAPRSVEPKLVKRILYLATVLALILIGFGLYWLDLHWYGLALVTLIGLWHLIKRALYGAPGNERPGLDDTQEIPVTITPREARALKQWQLMENTSTGEKHVLITEKTKVKVKVKIKPKHFWSLRGRSAYVVKRFEVFIEDSNLVDPKLIKRSGFKPTEGEDSIKVFSRLHWWSHGPWQLLIIALGLIVSSFVLFVITVKSGLPIVSYVPFGWALMMLMLGIAYLSVWIPWAFTFFIVTNLRVLLIYLPPFGLAGSHNQARIMHFQSISTEDQLNGPKWIPSFGNVLPKLWFVSIRGYKIFVASTPAEKDKWIEDGIPYVPDAERIEAIVSGIQTEILEADSARHEEDMDWQRRQAVAGEETRDLMRDFIDTVRPTTQQ